MSSSAYYVYWLVRHKTKVIPIAFASSQLWRALCIQAAYIPRQEGTKHLHYNIDEHMYMPEVVWSMHELPKQH